MHVAVDCVAVVVVVRLGVVVVEAVMDMDTVAWGSCRSRDKTCFFFWQTYGILSEHSRFLKKPSEEL